MGECACVAGVLNFDVDELRVVFFLSLVCSIGLQVDLLPLQACTTRPGDEPDLAFSVNYLPMLRGVVEFDVAGPGDLKLADFM